MLPPKALAGSTKILLGVPSLYTPVKSDRESISPQSCKRLQDFTRSKSVLRRAEVENLHFKYISKKFLRTADKQHEPQSLQLHWELLPGIAKYMPKANNRPASPDANSQLEPKAPATEKDIIQ